MDHVGIRNGVTDEYVDAMNIPNRDKNCDKGSAKKQIATAVASGKEYVHGKNNGLFLINEPLIGFKPSS